MELDELDREVAATEARIGEVASALTQAKQHQAQLRNERRSARRLQGRPDAEFAAPPVDQPPGAQDSLAQRNSDYRGQRGALEMKLAANRRELRGLEKELAEVNATNDQFRKDIAEALTSSETKRERPGRRSLSDGYFWLLVAAPRPLVVLLLCVTESHQRAHLGIAAKAFAFITAITWIAGISRRIQLSSDYGFAVVLAETMAWVMSGWVFSYLLF